MNELIGRKVIYKDTKQEDGKKYLTPYERTATIQDVAYDPHTRKNFLQLLTDDNKIITKCEIDVDSVVPEEKEVKSKIKVTKEPDPVV